MRKKTKELNIRFTRGLSNTVNALVALRILDCHKGVEEFIVLTDYMWSEVVVLEIKDKKRQAVMAGEWPKKGSKCRKNLILQAKVGDKFQLTFMNNKVTGGILEGVVCELSELPDEEYETIFLSGHFVDET